MRDLASSSAPRHGRYCARVQGEQAIDALSVEEVDHRGRGSRSPSPSVPLPLAFISSATRAARPGRSTLAHAAEVDDEASTLAKALAGGADGGGTGRR